MHLLPRALKCVSVHLFAPQEPGSPVHTGSATKSGSRPAEDRPSPHKWATILAEARHRRAPHLWPSPPQEPAMGALVRAYVLPEHERTRALASPTREAR
jgi:hypothetical protein